MVVQLPKTSERHFNQRDASAVTLPQLAHRNLTTRELAVRANSYNAEERSFEAVVATETPAQVMDWRTWDVIDEILVAEGGEFPERMPLLDSHQRWQSLDVLGSARNFRRDGQQWIGRGYFAADDPEVDRIAHRVRDGHITDVSIGYEVLAYVDIPARTSQVINGRKFKAGERTLRVTTKWRVRELSVTPIGADQQAKIRSQLGNGQSAAPNHRSGVMNSRLLAYVRKLMNNPNATPEEARAYMATCQGLQRTICNILDYEEQDTAARTTVDLAIRSLGYDPLDPTQTVTPGDQAGAAALAGARQQLANQATPTAGTDGASQLTPDQLRAEGARQENERQQQLRTMANGLVPAEMLTRAINEGWTVERAAPAFLQAIRDSRSTALSPDLGGGAPAGHSRNSVSSYERDALLAALMLRGSTGGNGQASRSIADPVARRFQYDAQTGGMRFVNASNDAEWCRAVDRGHQLRALPMVDICRQLLAQHGITIDGTPQQVVRAFSNPFETRAAMTIQAFVGIFTQTFGAIMLDSFMGTRDSTEQWTITRENPNFLQNERHRVTKGRALTRHAKGGEAEDFDLADTTEYTRVFRYSGKTMIDEIDLINDTMFDAMRNVTPSEMGESARRLRPDLVYSLLLANPNLQDGSALFNATYGNLLYSATLNKANLQRGTTCIRTRQENGVNLDLTPRFVITPAAMSYDRDELIRSATVVVAGDTDVVRGSVNALSNDNLIGISDSRLDNGVTNPQTGTAYAGDANDYYVATEASRHTIEVTRLRGSAGVPQMRSGLLDQGQWGIWFDIKEDLGAKALARAGICKLTPDSGP